MEITTKKIGKWSTIVVGTFFLLLGPVFELTSYEINYTDSGAVNSLLVTIGLILLAWKIVPSYYNADIARQNEKRQLKNEELLPDLPSICKYLGQHPYVSLIVIGLMIPVFFSLWASIRKAGLIIKIFLTNDWASSVFNFHIVDMIGHLLIVWLCYTLIVAVKTSEKGLSLYVFRKILISGIVAVATGILMIVPQLIDRGMYSTWVVEGKESGFPSETLIWIFAVLSASLAIFIMVAYKIRET